MTPDLSHQSRMRFRSALVALLLTAPLLVGCGSNSAESPKDLYTALYEAVEAKDVAAFEEIASTDLWFGNETSDADVSEYVEWLHDEGLPKEPDFTSSDYAEFTEECGRDFEKESGEAEEVGVDPADLGGFLVQSQSGEDIEISIIRDGDGWKVWGSHY